MSKKVIILGAKGGLGQYLLDEFESDSWEVFGFGKEGLDITNADVCRDKIEEIQPDAVINAAAANDVDGIEEDKVKLEKAKEINGYAPGNLAEICVDNDIEFVHYSTDFVFNGENKDGYTEESEPDPINRYGETKLLGEEEVQDKGKDYYIIRAARLFGNQGKSDNAKRSFVDTMIYLATEGGHDEVAIVDEQYGSPTYKKDLAKLTKNVIEGDYESGVYHGSNRGSCTWYGWAENVFKYADIDVDCKPVSASEFPREADVPAYAELKNTKLPEIRCWEDALNDYLS